MAKERSGSVRLLEPSDLGTKLIGWQSTSAGEGGLYNPRGFAMLRVVVQKIVEGTPQDLYDQPLLVENPGSIVVCRAGNKVGMVQSFRMVGERISEVDANYVARLNDERRWPELFAALGAWRWELPRGIPPTSDAPQSLSELVLKATKLEASQEAGFVTGDEKIVGRINTNPTFFAHAQYAVATTLIGTGEQQPEDLEIIGSTRFFTATEIRAMVNGELIDDVGFNDGLSKAALADAAFHY